METQCLCLICKPAENTAYRLTAISTPDYPEIAGLREEITKLREALSYYASGDVTKTFYGDERYMNLISDQMDISRVGECWKTGKRAREALEAK